VGALFTIGETTSPQTCVAVVSAGKFVMKVGARDLQAANHFFPFWKGIHDEFFIFTA
jgi:hypothetical protein